MNAHDKWLQAPYEAAAIDHEAMQARIAAEADSILAECANIHSATAFADDWEALMEDRAMLISVTCSIMAMGELDLTEQRAAIGCMLIDRVRGAAIKRATYAVTEAFCA